VFRCKPLSSQKGYVRRAGFQPIEGRGHTETLKQPEPDFH